MSNRKQMTERQDDAQSVRGHRRSVRQPVDRDRGLEPVQVAAFERVAATHHGGRKP